MGVVRITRSVILIEAIKDYQNMKLMGRVSVMKISDESALLGDCRWNVFFYGREASEHAKYILSLMSRLDS